MLPPIAATIAAVRSAVAGARRAGKRIGFVPTMGALHAGHAALIRAARTEAEFVVVSIFVNPTQFGPTEDFARYPRTLDADRELCAAVGTDLIFQPTPEELYPPAARTIVQVTGLQDVLDGPSRPGHFQGVATVVLKLFNIVQPDVAVFGQTDAQQALLIRRMPSDLDLPLAVRVHRRSGAGRPAMSSRNRYLDPTQRQNATCLIRASGQPRPWLPAENGPRRPGGGHDGGHRTDPGARIDYVACRVRTRSSRWTSWIARPSPHWRCTSGRPGSSTTRHSFPEFDQRPVYDSRANRKRVIGHWSLVVRHSRSSKMAHPLFGPELRMLLLEKNTEGLKAFVETLNPTTVAETLTTDEFTVEQVWEVLQTADPQKQAHVFEFFPIECQVRMAEGAGRPQMARLIELMSHDDRVALLRRLPKPVVDAILRLVDEADRRDIANLSRYGENTVGSIMTSDYAWLPADLTAQQALERLRVQAPHRETIYYVYIVDEPTRRLIGILTLRALVLADPRSPIRDILIVNDLVTLRASDDRETAVTALSKYGLIAIPVLDDDGRLVGILTHDDIVEVINQEVTEDIQRQAAVGPLREGYLEEPLHRLWYLRGRWLAVLFVLQMATINAMLHYEGQLKELIVLSAFVPVCLSVGGNAGSQAAALVTRGLALGQIETHHWFRLFRRELLVGLALGATIGVLGLVRTWLFTSEAAADGASIALLSYAVALSVSAICLTGTLVGHFTAARGQTRRRSGDRVRAFIATASDVLGIVIYFNIAAGRVAVISR